ncbi:hypothetical protein K505DRAFT_330716 [Melanomma pulvis-pyrius CBS 109.77]|uniref:Uncharacterized protein n=1 Tax=Melanomma pulvis-pyrius CBS 109.77 TaxID=1314802 RepID=A0A6A6WP60_9PLEO|nr:hypothetical protein K505DRAFT_330716 [Melanomma pulvis-pyrius CBS 109.77]
MRLPPQIQILASTKTYARRFAQVHDITITTGTSTGKFNERRPEEAAQQEEEDEEDEGIKMTQRNVFHQPLAQHSTHPPTGFLRTGYCAAPPSDRGNHSVAAIVSKEFLDFSAARGNDLRAAGVAPGCKWCLCVSRWREAFDARRDDADAVVPRVVLRATNERALEGVGLEELTRFSVDGGGEGGGASS